MTATLLVLLAGSALAALGGQLFIRGLIGFSAWWRLPTSVVAATLAAFATSAPELSVAINSAIAGQPEIALGEVLGSNVVNIALVLGIAVAFAPILVDRGAVAREYPAAAAAPALVGLLAVDGRLGRLDGLILLAVFAAWLSRGVAAGRRFRASAPGAVLERTRTSVVISLGLGLVMLILAGRAIVAGAVGISAALGWDGFVVGAVLVALGTSAPELVTVIIARLRGHDDVAVGTILGSNIFNTLMILGIAAVIHPIAVEGFETDVGVVASAVLVLLLIPVRGRLERWRSVPLLGSYVLVLALLAS
ncbi:sodium:calcium antiporter [Mycolicibacterium sp.]|uniref:sodium:calcium antiporter n=1 Tax=Mycolicibacterium sp. TaxID=2320850 RepID=UPI001D974B87|nr:sodium:calcium antiporter [Mycolicibacterium sp.]MCB1292061.1 sodium:calcium antiporter [Mycobacterium sp.]